MEKVAIIGMGIAGMGVAYAYEKEINPNNIKIDCYDSKRVSVKDILLEKILMKYL